MSSSNGESVSRMLIEIWGIWRSCQYVCAEAVWHICVLSCGLNVCAGVICGALKTCSILLSIIHVNEAVKKVL